MNYDEINSRLKPCRCGGKVKIKPLGYGYDTFDFVCMKCGGVWHKNTYSIIEAAESWGMEDYGK